MSIHSNSGTNFASRWGTWCECLKRPLATGVYPLLLYCGVGDQGEGELFRSQSGGRFGLMLGVPMG